LRENPIPNFYRILMNTQDPVPSAHPKVTRRRGRHPDSQAIRFLKRSSARVLGVLEGIAADPGLPALAPRQLDAFLSLLEDLRNVQEAERREPDHSQKPLF
jgi:hypothetical protein